MRTDFFLTALVAFAPFSNAGALSSDFLLGRSLDLINDLTSDEAIFQAFGEAGHADTAPVQTWTNNKGEVYQSLYSFDEQEWQDMRASILSKNGLNETDVLEARGLVVRQDEDPPAFFCKNINTNPRVYTTALSFATAGICQSFVFGAEAYGRRQIVRRNFPDTRNSIILTTWSFTQKVYEYTSWTVAAGCGVAMNQGINEACDAISDGNEGEQPATSGFEGENDDIRTGITMTRA